MFHHLLGYVYAHDDATILLGEVAGVRPSPAADLQYPRLPSYMAQLGESVYAGETPYVEEGDTYVAHEVVVAEVLDLLDAQSLGHAIFSPCEYTHVSTP